MAEISGWIGAAILGICSVPQAYKSYRSGHSDGISPVMLWLWLFGMAFAIVYMISLGAIPAIINYSFNMLVAGVITWYYYFPRRNV